MQSLAFLMILLVPDPVLERRIQPPLPGGKGTQKSFARMVRGGSAPGFKPLLLNISIVIEIVSFTSPRTKTTPFHP